MEHAEEWSRGGAEGAERNRMKQSIAHVALVVRDYDEAIRLNPKRNGS